jgi:hypothetical protein
VFEDSFTDNQEYDLGVHDETAVYRISSNFAGTNVGRFGGWKSAVLGPAPTSLELNGQVWGTASATGAATKTTVRIASVQYDAAGYDPGAGSQPGAGAIADAVICVTEAAHGLSIGDEILVVLDSDVSTSAAFGTNGTNAEINGTKVVAFVTSELIFGWVGGGDADTDDDADATIDANVYVNPKFNVEAPWQTVDSQTLADTKVSLDTIPVAWEGIIELYNETENLMARTIVRDGVALQDNMQDNAIGGGGTDLLYESDAAVADTYQGIETNTAQLRIANEDAALNSYSIRSNCTPFRGNEKDGLICLSVQANRLLLKNMYGSTVTIRLERIR